MKIYQDENYKLITYEESIFNTYQLDLKLINEDYSCLMKLNFLYNHRLLQEGDFTDIVKRGNTTQHQTIDVTQLNADEDTLLLV